MYPDLAAIRATCPAGWTVEGCYPYTDPDSGRIDLVVLRMRRNGSREKRFWQFSPAPGGGFIMKAPRKPWPIYNRLRVRQADTVLVVEGENKVPALHGIGIVATCSPGGAENAHNADWSPLAGKTVYIWPDHDEAGRKYAAAVGEILSALDPAPTVLTIDPEPLGLPSKADAVDFLAGLGDVDLETKRAAVFDVLADARPAEGPAAEVRDLLEATIDGRRAAVEWPWPIVGRLTRALLPGTVTLLAGDPGAAKSFMLLSAAAFWHEHNVKAAALALEEDRPYHLTRALAQRTAIPDLFDDVWVRSNPDRVRSIYQEHRQFLNEFGRVLHEAPDGANLNAVAGWVRDRAREGCRVIAVDPITAAAGITDRTWEDDLKFMMTVKQIVRDTGASLILVTHPRKGRKTAIGLDELAGGAAYQRFAQTVIWIEVCPTPREVAIHSSFGGVAPVTVNRVLHLCKTRNGGGRGGK